MVFVGVFVGVLFGGFVGGFVCVFVFVGDFVGLWPIVGSYTRAFQKSPERTFSEGF